MRKALLSIAAGLCAAGIVAGAAIAADMKPDDSLKYRQGLFKALAWQLGPVVGMAKGEVPFNNEQLALRASNMNAISKMLAEGFPKGSADGEIAGSKAKPEIWTSMADFETKLAALQTATAALAADAGKLLQADLGKHVAAIGGSCKGCHDSYRNR